MKLSDTVTIPPQVVSRKVGKETVLLELASGIYFGLDDIGTDIWALMTAGRTLDEICTELLDRYDVDRAVLERDLLVLAGKLQDHGLIAVS